MTAARQLNRSTSFIMFSGGRTDPAINDSEANSYGKAFLRLLQTQDFLQRESVRDALASGRWAIEENATDSYQNLLFSIIQFRRCTGRYPEYITVITHAFKTRRFLELHAPAIRWPEDLIRVIGVDPEWGIPQEQVVTAKLEEINAIRPFTDDPYGVGEMLSGKRLSRQWNPSKLHDIGLDIEPEVQALLMWDQTTQFTGELPWSQPSKNPAQES